jgi:hypothetical protein
VTIKAAQTYHLSGFGPTHGIEPGRPTLVHFTIVQPDGKPLTQYREGKGPHTGADLVIVRSDDSHVLYIDTRNHPSGLVTQRVAFPAPGRYRVVIDAYPKAGTTLAPTNFQLFESVAVSGKPRLSPLPAFEKSEVVDGYRFTLVGTPALRAISPKTITFHVTDSAGRPAHFELWRGALAHAIFIRRGSLDYFHTHVCPPGANYCSSRLGGLRVSGVSSTPGVLKVGVLAPVPGVWRMFLLTYIGGRERVAPFTLTVK